MRADTLPYPGEMIQRRSGIEEQIGPCVDKCEHRDCAHTRRMAAAKCKVCKKRIGYSRPYYQFDELGFSLTHATCHDAPEIVVGSRVARENNLARDGEVVSIFRATNGKLTAKVKWPDTTRLGGNGFKHSSVALSSLVKVGA